jgi:hypothetical protein
MSNPNKDRPNDRTSLLGVTLSLAAIIIAIIGEVLWNFLNATLDLGRFPYLKLILDFSLQASGAAVGIAVAFWYFKRNLQKDREIVRGTFLGSIKRIDSRVQILKGMPDSLKTEEATSKQQKAAVSLYEDPTQMAALLTALGDSNPRSYLGRVASRDPRLLLTFLGPAEAGELQRISNSVAEAKLQADRKTEEAAKKAVEGSVWPMVGSIPTTEESPKRPGTTSAKQPDPVVGKKQTSEVPPDPVLQPAYAIGKGLITQDEFTGLKNEYFAQCELTLGLILPVIILAFAFSDWIASPWGLGLLAVFTGIFSGVLFAIALDRWFRYRMELKLLILGRWDKAREDAQKAKKPKSDKSEIEKVVKDELSKLQVEVKPLVVELHQEEKKPKAQG